MKKPKIPEHNLIFVNPFEGKCEAGDWYYCDPRNKFRRDDEKMKEEVTKNFKYHLKNLH
jgi:hypothetical protein